MLRLGTSSWICARSTPLGFFASRSPVSSSRTSLPPSEGAVDLLRERLRDVGEHGALAGSDEGLDRHSGDEPQALEPSDLALRKSDPHDIVGGAGALVGGEIGGDAADDTIELGRGALVESGEAQRGALPDPHLIDILRRELRLDGQHVRLRYDQHDRLAGGDHATDRMHSRLMHHPVLRRADVDALQLILGRDLALDELGDLALRLAQVLGDLAAQFLIDLQDLQLDLGDFALGLGGRGDELTALAFEAGRVALERRHALDLHEVLAPEIPDPLELLPDQLGLALLRRHLTGEALDLLLELRDPLPELCLLAGSRRAAELEQVPLPGHAPGGVGIARASEELRGKADAVDVVALGLEPSEAGLELVEALHHDREVRLRNRLVEPDHDVASLDLIAVADPELADDAAGRMLDLLDVRVDDEAAGRDHGSRQLGRRRKPADPAGEKRHDRNAPEQVLADRRFRGRLHLAHAFAPWVSTTLRTVPPPGEPCPASAGRRSTLFRTSSLGPKVWAFPSAITRMKSTPASALGRCAITTTMRPRARAPRIACVSACSPSVSRFEFGSSSTRRNGSR